MKFIVLGGIYAHRTNTARTMLRCYSAMMCTVVLCTCGVPSRKASEGLSVSPFLLGTTVLGEIYDLYYVQ